MFRANSRLIASEIQNNSLYVENLVIQLYTRNLSAVCIQAAVIAGIAFSALNNIFYILNAKWSLALAVDPNAPPGVACDLLEICYHTISFIISLIIMCHAVFAILFGPKKVSGRVSVQTCYS
jgi:hypothetical protein